MRVVLMEEVSQQQGRLVPRGTGLHSTILPISVHMTPCTAQKSDGSEFSDSSGDCVRTRDDCSGRVARGITRGREGVHLVALRVSLGIRRQAGAGRLWCSRRDRGSARCFSSNKHGPFSCIAPARFSTSLNWTAAAGGAASAGSFRRTSSGAWIFRTVQSIQPENRSRSGSDLRSGTRSALGLNTNQQPKKIVCRNQK